MKGDFLGFSFDGIHCSQLGITRVSSSDRYDEDLFPEVKDKTIEIPNNHGEYYYGSTYGTRTFEIEIAYDSITEKQFRNIRRLFGTRKICELIFDERPYKVYYAKIESPIEMSYVCFDEPKRAPSENEQDGIRVTNRVPITEEQTIIVPVIDEETGEQMIDEETGEPVTREETQTVTTGYTIEREQIRPWVYEYNEDGTYKTQRIYKGEGTVSLICYQPFAHQLFKILDLYKESGTNTGNLLTTYTNVDEWADSSGLLTQEEWNQHHIDQVVDAGAPYTYAIPVYNPGDLDVGFCLYIPFVNKKICPADGKTDIIINGDSDLLVLKEIDQKGTDAGIVINTRTHLIEGVSFSGIANLKDYRKPAWETTGNLYNEYIKMGEFPMIKRNDWKFDTIDNRAQTIYISCAEANKDMSIYYDYLYF